jgi:hypothetical protein
VNVSIVAAGARTSFAGCGRNRVSQKEDSMKADLYTKVMLTIIAVCLAWLCMGGPSLMTAAQAQSSPTEVVIVGWKEGAKERNAYDLGFRALPVRTAPK